MPLITVLAGSQGSECGISLNNQDCRIKTRRQEQGGHTAAICVVAAVLGGGTEKEGGRAGGKRAAGSCGLDRARLVFGEPGRRHPQAFGVLPLLPRPASSREQHLFPPKVGEGLSVERCHQRSSRLALLWCICDQGT